MNRRAPEIASRLLYLLWLNLPPARPALDRLMRRRFDALAGSWTERTLWDGRLEPLDKALTELSPTPVRIVELGCGSGAASVRLAGRFSSAWVLGIDISEKMLEQARESAREAGAAVQFRRESIDHTSLEDGSIDLVVVVNAPPPFKEISRILTPAGRAVVVYTRGPETWFYSSHSRLRRGFARAAMVEVCSGTVGKGEYFGAAPVALPARTTVSAARERATQASTAGVPR